MSPRERQLARLLRALIACCALLFAFAPPTFAAGAPRDTSGWIAERVAIATRAVARAPQAARGAARPLRTAPTPSFARAALPAIAATRAPAGQRQSFDARHLYLDLLTLLC
jgi:hypothetical protein